MQWLWMIPLLPLVGSLLQGILLLSGSTDPRASKVIGVGFPAVTLSVVFAALWQYTTFQHPTPFLQSLYTWSAGEMRLELELLLDPLSAVLVLIVAFVGLWIHIFSIGILKDEEHAARFLTYFAFLQGMMFLLVLAGNFVVFLAGWQGIALATYLLLGLRSSRRQIGSAGSFFWINRIGDAGLLVAICALFARFGDLQFLRVEAKVTVDLAFGMDELWLGLSWSSIVALGLCLAAVARAAQIPLHVWLPESTLAARPALAIIHTFVASSGIYLLLRCQWLLDVTPGVSAGIAILGTTTAFFAATCATAQIDIRRALAYIAISQLGQIFLAIGMGEFAGATFHLASYVFLSALLFLAADSVIQALLGEHDLRAMGGLRARLPWTSATFLIGAMSLAGLPGLAGFFSGNATLLAVWQGSKLMWLLGVSSVLIITFSLSRVYWLTFWGRLRSQALALDNVHESSTLVTAPLVVLAAASLAIGISAEIPLTNLDWLGGFLGSKVAPESVLTVSSAPSLFLRLLLLATFFGATVLGILASWRIYGSDFGLEVGKIWSNRYPSMHRALRSGYRLHSHDSRLSRKRAQSFLVSAGDLLDWVILPSCLSVITWVSEIAAGLLRFTTTGKIRHYALYFLTAVLVIFFWIAF